MTGTASACNSRSIICSTFERIAAPGTTMFGTPSAVAACSWLVGSSKMACAKGFVAAASIKSLQRCRSSAAVTGRPLVDIGVRMYVALQIIEPYVIVTELGTSLQHHLAHVRSKVVFGAIHCQLICFGVFFFQAVPVDIELAQRGVQLLLLTAKGFHDGSPAPPYTCGGIPANICAL